MRWYSIALPPTSNHRLMPSASGRGLIKSPVYRSWMQNEALAIACELPESSMPIDRPCYSIVQAFFPDRRKRDLDNILKSVNDVLVRANVIGDDSLITAQVALRAPFVKGTRGHVEVLLGEDIGDFEVALSEVLSELKEAQTLGGFNASKATRKKSAARVHSEQG